MSIRSKKYQSIIISLDKQSNVSEAKYITTGIFKLIDAEFQILHLKKLEELKENTKTYLNVHKRNLIKKNKVIFKIAKINLS